MTFLRYSPTWKLKTSISLMQIIPSTVRTFSQPSADQISQCLTSGLGMWSSMWGCMEMLGCYFMTYTKGVFKKYSNFYELLQCKRCWIRQGWYWNIKGYNYFTPSRFISKQLTHTFHLFIFVRINFCRGYDLLTC